MKKRLLGLFIIVLSIVCCSKNVYAQENIYYTTPNGIELTKDEYDFLTTFYWDGYVDVMSKAQYQEFLDLDIANREVKIVKSNQEMIGPGLNNTRATSQTEKGRTIQIGAACNNTNCHASILVTWNESPNVRSYDLIGAFISGESLVAHGTTFVNSTAGLTTFNNLVTDTHGIGNSVKLPTNGENIVINMIFTTTNNGSGIIYGSYQHAMSYITLQNSQNYTFSLGGYGNVFDFNGSTGDNYDEAAGVQIYI